MQQNTKKCLNCKKDYKKNYKYSKTQWKNSRYCSRKCQSNYKTKTNTTHADCLICGKRFVISNSEVATRKHCSKECFSKAMKKKYTGKDNPFWNNKCSGKYCALHEWIKRRVPKTKYCQECGIEPPLDLANISQEYKQDLDDWEWLCRRCHMVKDGRLEKINNRTYEIIYRVD